MIRKSSKRTSLRKRPEPQRTLGKLGIMVSRRESTILPDRENPGVKEWDCQGDDDVNIDLDYMEELCNSLLYRGD
jgi:hypothetical protein